MLLELFFGVILVILAGQFLYPMLNCGKASDQNLFSRQKTQDAKKKLKQVICIAISVGGCLKVFTPTSGKLSCLSFGFVFCLGVSSTHVLRKEKWKLQI